jgi:carbamoyltransferase
VYILGISALYHDSAAALLRDGDLIAAAQEERFSRVKFDSSFPTRAIAYCLRQAGITAHELDYVVFYDKPLSKFERILTSQLSTYPRSWQVFREAMIAWFKERLWLKSLILSKLPLPADRVLFMEHHISHAASAMFCSPFQEAAVLTVDGVGEWTTTSLGHATADWGNGQSNRIDLTDELRFPHSLGLLYSAFTAWLGFKVNSGEYKVMGMAPYGEPRYMDKIEKLIKVYDDGSFWLNMDYFSFHYSPKDSYNAKFVELFGPPRAPESPFFTRTTGDDIRDREAEADQNQYYADVAASVQHVTEEVLLKIVHHLHRQTGSKNLVLAGGVALNSVANGRIMRETAFEQVFIQPNAGDAGGALGAALYVWHVLLGKPRRFVMEHAYYGEALDRGQVQRFLDEQELHYERLEDPDRLADRIVEALLHQKVIGLAQGRFEWGQRALGNRSIIADPRSANMKEIVNSKIKFRELFRPFAPAVTEEAASRYFDLQQADGQYPPRFMMMVSPVFADRATEIPAVTHMGTARLQTVRRDWNPLYYDVLDRFGQATGVPVLMNTSFNLRSEPIVSTPADAFNTFAKSELDLLVLGDFVVSKAGMGVPRERRSMLWPATKSPVGVAVGAAPGTLDYVERLLCPACQGALETLNGSVDSVACAGCQRRFPCEAGIPLLYWPTEETHRDSVSDLVKEFYEQNPFPGYEDVDTAHRLREKAREGIFAKLLDDQIPEDALVLEVGCGTGQLSNFLAIDGRAVFGADLCLNSLKLAQAFRARNRLDSVHFVQMNLFRPVFPERSFDFVICSGVLHHTADPFGGFQSLGRLVRPGGYIVIGLYNTFGRVWTDLRRAIFHRSGDRFRFLDPYLARKDVDEGKKRIWFADQYKHPHESKHSLDEALRWFDQSGFEFVNAIPKPTPFAKLSEYEALFRTNPRGSRRDHLLAQLQLALTGGSEGGFFVVIGKRKA